MTPFLLFAVLQTSAAQVPVAQPPVEILRQVESRLDALLALPSLAQFRAARDRTYRDQSFKVAWRSPRSAWINIGDLSISFKEDTGFITALFDNSMTARTPAEVRPLAELTAKAEAILADVSFGVSRPYIELYTDSRFSYSASRVYKGRPVTGPISLDLNPTTGLIEAVLFSEPIDGETLGGASVLSDETLDAAGYAAYARTTDMAQAELKENVIWIALPGVSTPEYQILSERRIGIPVRILSFENSYGNVCQIRLDARNGRVLDADMMHAIGGSNKEPSPLPNQVVVGGVTGRLTRLGGRTLPEASSRVAVTSGKTVWLGRFDAGSNTLWLRRSKMSPFTAFRPNARLGAALKRQSKADG